MHLKKHTSQSETQQTLNLTRKNSGKRAVKRIENPKKLGKTENIPARQQKSRKKHLIRPIDRQKIKGSNTAKKKSASNGHHQEQYVGQCSFNASGIAFIRAQSLNDYGRNNRAITIPANQTKGALQMDRVKLRIRKTYGQSLSGEVIKIVKRQQETYRLKLIEKKKNGKWQVEILDQPHAPLATLATSRKNSSTDKEPFSVLSALKIWGKRLLSQTKTTDGSPRQKSLKLNDIVLGNMNSHTRYQLNQPIRFIYLQHEKTSTSESPSEQNLNRVLLRLNLQKEYPTSSQPNNYQKNLTNSDLHRRDLRSLFAFTIDGETTKDFDDALSIVAATKGRGNPQVTLYAHIADVSAFVPANSALDLEARERGTSYYLEPYVIPMLPPALSEDLCSLQENKERRTVTTEINIDLNTGKTLSTKFYRSLIRIDKRLTYNQANAILQKNPVPKTKGKLTVNDLPKHLNSATLKNHKKRDTQTQSRARISKTKRNQLLTANLQLLDAMVMRRQQADLENDKLFIQLEKLVTKNQASFPQQKLAVNSRSSQIIETCMVIANEAVARFLREKKIPAFYRIHPKIQEKKVKIYQDICRIYRLNPPQAFVQKKINTFLQSLAKKVKTAELRNFLQIQLIRTLEPARYSTKPLGHWGLGLANYCHFTSPIRRYPDLQIHRALLQVIQPSHQPMNDRLKKKKKSNSNEHSQTNYKKKDFNLNNELEKLAGQCSEKEREAMDAERTFLKLETIDFIKKNRIRHFHGILTTIKKDLLFFMLLDYPAIQAEVASEALGLHRQKGKFRHQNNSGQTMSFFSPMTGKRVYLGATFALKLRSIDKEKMKIICSTKIKSKLSV